MTITCESTRKTFRLGVDSQLRYSWVFHTGKWREVNLDSKVGKRWLEDNKYDIASTRDMLECWLNFLPGVLEWNDYYDFSVTFDMDEVKRVGWNERQLIYVLEDMSSRVKMHRVIHADPPWQESGTDSWGDRRQYYRYPAIEPLGGMLEKEYPSDLTPTG